MFIAKNKDLIILAKDTKEELEKALLFMVYDTIEETQEKYVLVGGEYKNEQEYFVILKEEKQQENIDKCNEMRYGQEFTCELQGQECLFDTTEQTERDLMKAFMVCSTGATYDNWVTNNYVVINLTQEDVLTIYERFNMLVTPLYAVQKHYNDLIENAKTIEELQAIEIDYNINLE